MPKTKDEAAEAGRTLLQIIEQNSTDNAKLADKLNTLPDSIVGSIKQFLYSKNISVTPDSQGRIVLTPELLRYAAIDKNAVIIGVGDHLQVWSDTLWDEKEQSFDTNELAASLRELGL